jgi:hypothetical protein
MPHALPKAMLLAVAMLSAPGAIARADGFALPEALPPRMAFTGRLNQHPEPATYTLTAGLQQDRPTWRATWRSRTRDVDTVLDARSGRPLRTVATDRDLGYTVTIDYAPDGARYRYAKNGQPPTEKWIAHADLYDGFTLDLLLLGYPFDAPRTLRLSLIDTSAAAGKVYDMTVRADGFETVEASGKRLRCHRLKLAVSGVLGAFAPVYRFYYTADPPRAYVKLASSDEEYLRSDL